jgi:hypothetical protein
VDKVWEEFRCEEFAAAEENDGITSDNARGERNAKILEVTRYTVILFCGRKFFTTKFLPYFSPLALVGLLYTIIVIFAEQAKHNARGERNAKILEGQSCQL